MTEMYTEKELDALESHIGAYYGSYESVLHEIVSPDIHVDICLLEPCEQREHYTLITMGMGAHRMNVPPQLAEHRLERAELIIELPADWDIHSSSEADYWPIRWLKILARLPIEHDTWLGWGHTVPNGGPFAENTELSGVLLTMPYYFGPDAATCTLPSGEVVNFYQVVPLHEAEMQYKIANGAEALEELLPDDFTMVVDINRASVV